MYYSDFPLDKIQPVQRDDTIHVIRGTFVSREGEGFIDLTAPSFDPNPHFVIILRNVPHYFNDRSLYSLFSSFVDFEISRIRVDRKGIAAVLFSDPRPPQRLFTVQSSTDDEEDDVARSLYREITSLGMLVEPVNCDASILSSFLQGFPVDI
ncbi:hypothetical protein RCL1_007181 [Eukaryota sp. TZLM3-RCL]